MAKSRWNQGGIKAESRRNRAFPAKRVRYTYIRIYNISKLGNKLSRVESGAERLEIAPDSSRWTLQTVKDEERLRGPFRRGQHDIAW